MAKAPIVARKPTTLNVPFRSIVQRNDPDYEAAKHREVFYEFRDGKRIFTGDNSKRGPYSTAPNITD